MIVRGLADDFLLELSMGAAEARARLRAAINRPPRRFLGLLKIRSEFVGAVEADAFELWERRAHAVHALGQIEGTGRGSRVRGRFVLMPRTRFLLVAFFLLYLAGGFGLMSLPGSAPFPFAVSLAVFIAGGVAMGLFFALSARRQRTDLRRFVSGVFEMTAEGARALPRVVDEAR
jgi:hypothetical protein